MNPRGSPPAPAARAAYPNPWRRRLARLAASAALLALIGCAPQRFVREGATPTDDFIVVQECRVVALTSSPPYEPGLPDRGYGHYHRASLGDSLGLLAVVAFHQAVVGSWREEVFRGCLRQLGYMRVE